MSPSTPEVLRAGTKERDLYFESLEEIINNGLDVVGTIEDKISDGPDGLYVATELLGGDSEIVVESIDKPIGQLELGAADSQHAVKFANVSYKDSFSKTEQVTVAVKYFDDKIWGASIECDALLEAKQRGLDTLIPWAILKEGEDTYLFTLYRPEISSMDNQDWTKKPGEEGFEVVVDNLEFIAKSLGKLHAKGIFHGDAQPKNFTRSDIGEFVAIDLEEGCTIAEDDQSHIEIFNGKDNQPAESEALHDLRMFWMTLNRAIGKQNENMFLGEDPEPKVLFSVFNESFIQPYKESLVTETNTAVLKGFRIKPVISLLIERIKRDLQIKE